MSEELEGATAIGWALYKKPYTSAGGHRMNHRHVQIMVVDEYVISGFGVGTKPIKYTVEKFATTKAAKRHAVTLTARRERTGFSLSRDPRSLEVRGGRKPWLDQRVGEPARKSSSLAGSFSVLFARGTKLGELSPALSPF